MGRLGGQRLLVTQTHPVIGVGRLVVAGAETDACIRSTIHGAFTRGYDTILVGDALQTLAFEITADHFLAEYKTQARAFVYDSDHLEDVETFSSDTGIQVMIINAQNFNRDAKKADQDSAESGKSSGLKMFKTLDGFKSRRPIDVIAANRPVSMEMAEQVGPAYAKTAAFFRELGPRR